MPTRARSGISDARTDLRKSCGYLIHFFSWASIPLACAAN
jgi:hypothetical protein